MKTSFWIAIFFCLVGLTSLAQNPKPAAVPEPVILERGPHHRIVQHAIPSLGADGNTVFATNTYVELTTGMHFRQDEKWVESKETIEVTPIGGLAKQGPHKVAFAANLNSAWSIDMLTTDSKRFRSHVLGLAYTDSATGKSVLIAEVKDSIGQIVGPTQNQVIYKDAFTDIQADVRYTYTRAGFEQDVILRERPPSPEDYGLNPVTTRLEIFTEFLDPPQPNKSQRVIRQEADAQRRQAMVDPDFTDEFLEFGETQIGAGRAFSLGNQPATDEPGTGTVVGKSWIQIDARDFLIEKVEYPAIKAQIDALPRAALPAKEKIDRLKNLAAKPGAVLRTFPAAPKVLSQAASPMRVAARSVEEAPGFILDYATLSTGGPPGNLFQSDTTYFISGSLNLSGVVTIEGGTVIKFSKPPSQSAPFNITGANSKLNCLTSPYRPAVFTAKDDNSVGETISGSTGIPTGTYPNYAIYIDYNSTGVASDLSNLRIRYAKVGIYFNGGTTHVVSHSQFVNCETAIQFGGTSEARLRNGLVYNASGYFATSTYGFDGPLNSKLHGENITFDRLSFLKNNSVTVNLTNCLLANVATPGSYNGVANSTVTSPATDFKTLGAGSHYLAGATYRDAGTSLINATLLGELQQRTTYAPEEKTSDFTGSGTIVLGPSTLVLADTGAVDMGYHYDLVDYAWGGRNLYCTLLLTNGAAVALYGTTGTTLQSGAQFLSEGSPTKMNRLTRYNTVQEGTTVWGTSGSVMALMATAAGTLAVQPDIRLRFTETTVLGDAKTKRYIFNSGTYKYNASLMDCVLLNPYVYLFNSDSSQTTKLGFTNNLVQRPYIELYEGYYGAVYALELQMRNNTFLGGSLILTYINTYRPWGIYDNFFDTVSVTTNINNVVTYPIPNSHNGYLGTTQLGGANPAGSNRTISTRDYQVGTLGTNYYQTTVNGNNLATLIGAGSRSAAEAGLYHYTVRADQIKEAANNARVAIGFHYVALNSNGQPSDTDSDGIPDYREVNPSISIGSSPLTYTENAAPITVASGGSISGPASNLPLAGWTLQISLESMMPEDIFDLPLLATIGAQTGRYGNSVRYNGVVIGTVSGGQNGPLLITFNSDSRRDSAQAVLLVVNYRNTSEHFSITTARRLNALLVPTDGSVAGAGKDLTVARVNDPPVIAPIASQRILPNKSTNVTVNLSDADTSTSSITLTATSDAPAIIPNGNLILSGSGATRNLKITPLANAVGSANITVTASDGAASAFTAFKVTIGYPPAILFSEPPLDYYPGAGAVPLDTLVTVEDKDHPNPTTFQCLKNLKIHTEAGDVVTFVPSGTITLLSDNSVYQGATKIGLMSGGNGADLIFNFTQRPPPSLASPPEVQAVLRLIMYSSDTAAAAKSGFRSVGATLTDNDDLVSTAIRQVKIHADRPPLIVDAGPDISITLTSLNNPSPIPISIPAVIQSPGYGRTVFAEWALVEPIISGWNSESETPGFVLPLKPYADRLNEEFGGNPKFVLSIVAGGQENAYLSTTVINPASASVPLRYRFRLSAYDGFRTVIDEVLVRIFPINDAERPEPHIRATRALKPGSKTTLVADVLDENVAGVQRQWEVESPPGSVIDDPAEPDDNWAYTNGHYEMSYGVNKVSPKISFNQSGRYRVTLKVRDGANDSTMSSDSVVLTVCNVPGGPADIIIAADTSKSMWGGFEWTPTSWIVGDAQPITSVKSAGMVLAQSLDSSLHQVGLITFAYDASSPPSLELTHDPEALRPLLQSLEYYDHGSSGTRGAPALRAAVAELFSSRRNSAAQPVIVMITDGEFADKTEVRALAKE